MAKFLFWSDLHCEFAPFEIPVPGCQAGATPGAPTRDEIDGILLPGDIDVRGRHVDWLINIWDKWRVPVLAVAGNHEAYGAKRYQKHEAEERTRIAEARALGVDIDVMRRAERIIGDTRILGATFWTDMQLYPEMAGYAQHSIRDAMNDYKRVQWHDERRGIYRKMQPMDTIAMHQGDRDYIFERLDQPFDGKTIVMTHHLPLMQMMEERRLTRRDPVDAAYASDLWPQIGSRKVDAWICGHSHMAQERVLTGADGTTAFLNNIRGYPNEQTRFHLFRILDSEAPSPHLQRCDEGPSM